MLTLSNIRKTFGTIVAVDAISLDIRPGEVFGLLGPNGAGKSTTIAMAIGLVTPDGGSVSILGGDPRSADVRRQIGVAPQSLALYDDLSAEENLAFFASLYGMSGRDRHTRVAAALEQVGLSDRKADPVRGFSGGMKRRLNLAAAVVHEPKLVMLDEPTAGVDPQSRNNILDMVRALASKGVTVLYTTHYMEEAQKLCDRVGIIDHGRMLDVGTVQELISRHGGRSVVTVTTDAGEQRSETTEPLREIERAMAKGDARNIRIDQPDLESVFLTLTGRSLRDS